MQTLLDGIVKFKKNDFESYKDLFTDLGREQKPHTLFIGCSDSRVVPNLITKTVPGELFMIRNIANLVPMYRISEEFLATTSAIEYAVQVLNVENILVCGHSNCGGCASLYLREEELNKIPHTKKWLELAKPIKEKVLKQLSGEDISAREWLTEQMNIVEQIKHLFTYPFIREKYQKQQLNIYGWYYIIETGEIFNYNEKEGCFELIN
ncbi:MAG: carbonic anhydrase [Spirochaetes bacterium GWD1_27_9]|nr:MAG: carbonic anhydrase [Spirochaetes bacterium GWB1_27_13]OHD20772.1 MAG: carbonic anhydrase [Spirochaetes bacterium GWC1_27_15]OHD30083.1 MAG: carbonic anhydrase [Spirochaetes bacterium GWD1_27_9]